jgi:hypothetical protein
VETMLSYQINQFIPELKHGAMEMIANSTFRLRLRSVAVCFFNFSILLLLNPSSNLSTHQLVTLNLFQGNSSTYQLFNPSTLK